VQRSQVGGSLSGQLVQLGGGHPLVHTLHDL
jgi:hypothetical protein